jgi:antirestriction protein ArdC
MARAANASIHDTITNQIITALERGTVNYNLTRHRNSAQVTRSIYAVNRKTYRGDTVLAPWASAEAQDLGHGLCATYRQWQSLSAN